MNPAVREKLLRFGLILVSATLSLGLAEGVTRLLALDRVVMEEMHNSESGEAFGNRVRVKDERIGWFLNGYNLDGEGLTIDFPKPRTYSRKRKPGQYRILVLGDSVAEVWPSMDPAQKFPQMLEDSLNQSGRGKKFEVLNVSVGSYDTAQRAAVLETYLDGFEFDFLVVQHCFNDAVGPYVHKGSRDGKEIYARYSLDIPGLKFFSDSRLLGSAFFRALNLAAYAALRGALPGSVGVIGRFSDRQEGSYRRIKAYCAARGAGLLVLMFPHLSDLSDQRYRWWHYQDESSQRLLRGLDIRHYSLYGDYSRKGFKGLRADPGDYTHPGPEGHRLAAAKLLELLAPVFPNASSRL